MELTKSGDSSDNDSDSDNESVHSVSGEKSCEKESYELALEKSADSVPQATNQTNRLGFVDWEPADLEM